MDNATHLTPKRKVFLSRRFWPMFLTQFFGALNDNLFRNAIFVLVTFKLAASHSAEGPIIISLGAGLFILPFFLFSATAGLLIDRYKKNRLITWLKSIECLLAVAAGSALILQNVLWMLGVLFLLGTQAAFFGPLKYSILPELVGQDELVSANAYIEGGTFLAILMGTIAGGALVVQPSGTEIVAVAMVIMALLGLLASFAIPTLSTESAAIPLRWCFVSATWPTVTDAIRNRPVWRAILGISWFWFVGAIFLSVLPNYVRDVLNGGPHLVTFLLTIFSVGIGAGSLLCSRLLKGRVDASYVPFAGIALGIATLVLEILSRHYSPGPEMITVLGFMTSTEGMLITAALFALAAIGGIFTVPLYTILQVATEPSHRARTIAANNIINSLFMVISSIFTLGMFKYGYSVTSIFLVVAILCFLVAIYICGLMTRNFSKSIFRFLFRILYGVKVYGLENFEQIKNRGAVIIVNHTSLLDGVLLAAFLPGYPTFAVNTQIAETWWAKLFLGLVDHHIIDSTKPLALKSLVYAVNQGEQVVIFPEGRITVTGALMKIYEGPGVIAQKAQAPILPVRIDGALQTPFSYLRKKVHIKYFPRITLTVLPPVALRAEPGLTFRQRRQATGDQLYNIMAEMIFSTCNIEQTLVEALWDARHLHGGSAKIMEDIERHPLSYNRLITTMLVLSRRLDRLTKEGKATGVMLPNSIGVAVVFFSLLLTGRIPAMLNFTSGLANIQSACKAAEITTLFTSRRLIERARLGALIEGLSKDTTVIYLEDVRVEITLWDKLCAIFGRPFALLRYRRRRIQPNDPAVILFTSGSEGTPKGVVLSHKNILANRYQLGARIDFTSSDLVFNALPVFHSFGLTAGLLLPILSGVKTFLYPSPLHYRIISELVYDTNATIVFGTDTFLTGYARMAHVYDFYSVRYVFAGAERVKDETRKAWQEKFGLRIFEGYGATETAPTLAINTPLHAKAGSVGRLLPGISHRLLPVDGVAAGGRLIVKGPNVMRGYLKSSAPGVLEPPEEGWYDTGDIVEIDSRGFVTIVGRVKRFAKIGGEMVSLGAIEDYLHVLYADTPLAVVAVTDDEKGELLMVLTESDKVKRDAIGDYARAHGIGDLMIPRMIAVVEKIPLLGTGKTDYVGLEALAKDVIKKPEANKNS